MSNIYTTLGGLSQGRQERLSDERVGVQRSSAQIAQAGSASAQVSPWGRGDSSPLIVHGAQDPGEERVLGESLEPA